MATGAGGWKSDVPISMPRPLDGHGPNVTNNQSLIPMFGFTFTINGLFHDLSNVDLEEYVQSLTSPQNNVDTHYSDGDARPQR